MSQPPVVLASASPYRRELLIKAGLQVTVCPALGDEKSVLSADPRRLAIDRATFKAVDAADRSQPGALVIGADQVLSCGSRVYDKACDLQEAKEHLSSLAGKTHFLHSGVAIARRNLANGTETLESFAVSVPMIMRKLSVSAIDRYLRLNEWQGSVGCYKIEGRGIQLLEAPIGDSFAIIGLPLAELFASLRRLGVDPLESTP